MKVITKCPVCFHEITATVGTHFGALVKCHNCNKVLYIEGKENVSEHESEKKETD